MLTNKSKVGYNTENTDSYTYLDSIKEIPEIGGDPELVENSTLGVDYKQYEAGVGDPGDLEFKFKWENTKSGSETRKLLELCALGKPVFWQIEYPDGTKYSFSATPTRKISGGGINSPVELTIKMALNGKITETFAG